MRGVWEVMDKMDEREGTVCGWGNEYQKRKMRRKTRTCWSVGMWVSGWQAVVDERIVEGTIRDFCSRRHRLCK